MDANSHVSDVDDATFLEVINKGEGFQVVDFWAPWCAPCRMMEPGLIGATRELDIPMYKLLIDTNNITPTRYGVMGIPTVLVFHNGKEVGRIVGVQPKSEIIYILKNIIEDNS